MYMILMGQHGDAATSKDVDPVKEMMVYNIK